MQEAAENPMTKHMVPFEASAEVRAMDQTKSFTKKPKKSVLFSAKNLKSTNKLGFKPTSRTAAGYSPALKRPRTSRSHHAEDISPSVTPRIESSAWSLSHAFVPLPAIHRTVDLHLATDGSVLGENGRVDACGGIGFAWQWGDDVTTRGHGWECMPWNAGGTFYCPQHTNIRAEWYAVWIALQKLMTKASHRPDDLAHVHLHMYIDCNAVLHFLQKRLDMTRSKKPVLVEQSETNPDLKTFALEYLRLVVKPKVHSVTLHKVDAHVSKRSMVAMNNNPEKKRATELNEMADVASKKAARAFVAMYRAPSTKA